MKVGGAGPHSQISAASTLTDISESARTQQTAASARQAGRRWRVGGGLATIGKASIL
jgi:hypothetical protein